MKSSTRDRLVLPILIPVLGLVFIALLVVGFSRVLLSVSPTAATVTATVVAFGIMLIATRVAALKRIRASSLASMLGAVAGVAMIAGGIALAAIGPEEPEKPEEQPVVVAIAAGPNAAVEGFDRDTLSFPPGEPVELEFDNQDPGVPHNVAVYADEGFAEPVFVPDGTITGPAQAAYGIEPLEEGTYFFRCEVHPITMTGTIEVAPGGGGGGGGGGPSSVPIFAEAFQFSESALSLPADTASTIEFDNRDAGVQHNVAIYRDEGLDEVLFRGDLVTGPAKVDYDVPALPAGTYYFQCDVHPPMNGTVTVG
ncbi:MAG: cupredoxin domain-containing protein [Actinomycetota bacterium]